MCGIGHTNQFLEIQIAVSPFARIFFDEGIVLMNDKQCIFESRAEEAVKPKMTDEFVKDRLVCIFRERDLLRNQVHCAVEKHGLGVGQRIKRKIGRLFHHDRGRGGEASENTTAMSDSFTRKGASMRPRR